MILDEIDRVFPAQHINRVVLRQIAKHPEILVQHPTRGRVPTGVDNKDLKARLLVHWLSRCPAWVRGSMTTVSCKTTVSRAAVERDLAVSRRVPASALGRRDDPDPRGIREPPYPARQLDDPDDGPNDDDDK